MALAEGTPGNWAPGSFPVPYQLGTHVELVSKGDGRPPLPVVHFPARPVRLPSPGSK